MYIHIICIISENVYCFSSYFVCETNTHRTFFLWNNFQIYLWNSQRDKTITKIKLNFTNLVIRQELGVICKIWGGNRSPTTIFINIMEEHSEKDQILWVKRGKNIRFCLYHSSDLLGTLEKVNSVRTINWSISKIFLVGRQGTAVDATRTPLC